MIVRVNTSVYINENNKKSLSIVVISILIGGMSSLFNIWFLLLWFCLIIAFIFLFKPKLFIYSILILVPYTQLIMYLIQKYNLFVGIVIMPTDLLFFGLLVYSIFIFFLKNGYKVIQFEKRYMTIQIIFLTYIVIQIARGYLLGYNDSTAHGRGLVLYSITVLLLMKIVKIDPKRLIQFIIMSSIVFTAIEWCIALLLIPDLPQYGGGLFGLMRPNFYLDPMYNVIAVGICLAYFNIFGVRKWILFALLCNLSAVFISNTRSFWIGVIIQVLLFFICQAKFKPKGFALTLKKVLAIVLVIISIMGLGINAIQTDSFQKLQINYMKSDESVIYRVEETKDALNEYWDNPLIGKGIGAPLKRHFIEVDGIDNSSFIHNQYVFLLLNIGIIGLVIFVIYMYSLLKVCNVYIKRIRESNGGVLALSFIYITISGAVISITSPQFTNITVIPYIAVLAGVVINEYLILDLNRGGKDE